MAVERGNLHVLDFPPAIIPNGLLAITGTIRPSDCLHTVFLTRFLLASAYHVYIIARTHFYGLIWSKQALSIRR
jgi:hypothetical protein